MILYPAIDLKDGACVRLKRGLMDSATTFNPDPADQANIFASYGFSWLHIVDLNGAFAGASRNSEAIKAIRQTTKANIQLGGGLRDISTMDYWLQLGIDRLILGTVAVKTPDLVREACRKFPGRIALGIDARAGQVAVEGWAETSELAASDLVKRFEDSGAAAVIYTDIDRDGMLSGLNLPAVRNLAKATAIPVIASGGLADQNDIHQLARPENQMIGGAILGRAYYEGKVDPCEALALLGSVKS